ncbi:MAG: glycosyltransferase [Ardenticatenales bacterium]|nr:glycosyltransferase [Ardenticatenales bacterium]
MLAPTSFFADYGCHVRILEEALILRRLGHQVTIVTYHKGRPIADLDIIRTSPLPWRADYEVGSSRHKIAYDIYLAFTALRAALDIRPDVIHAHLHEGALIGAPIARLLGIPLVFDFQGSLTGEMLDHQFLNPDGPFFKPARMLERLINKLPVAILTSSLYAQRVLEEQFLVPSERIHPVPDCVNTETFRPAARGASATLTSLKGQLGIPAGRSVVIYLGLLATYQGTPCLIQSAAQLKAAGIDAHFLIMGYPGHQDYAQMAHGLGVEDRVTLTGKIPYEQAAHYLSVGDVAVAPKLSATEGSGKILNYMAMGLPTVAFDTPVQREYLGDLGVYAPPGDLDALTAGIRTLLDDVARRVELGAALRRRAKDQYSWERAGRRIISIYDQLESRRGKH